MAQSPLQLDALLPSRFDSTKPGPAGSPSSVLNLKSKRSLRRCERGQDVIKAASAIAKLATQEEREAYLIRHYDPAFHALIWASFPSAMAAEILGKSTVQERRISLESVPVDRDGNAMRNRVEMIVRHLWQKRRR